MKRIFTLSALIIVAFSSCKKDKATAPVTYGLDATTVSLHYDQQHQFSIKGSDGSTSSSTVTWTSSDTTVGVVDTKGLFKAKRIGSTTITANGSNQSLNSKVTVAPYYTLFQEPYALYLSDTTTIEAKEKRTIIGRFDSNYFGEDDFSLRYGGDNANITEVDYGFRNHKLYNCDVAAVSNSDAEYPTKFMTFYKERYAVQTVVSPYRILFWGDDAHSSFITVDVTKAYAMSAEYITYNTHF